MIVFGVVANTYVLGDLILEYKGEVISRRESALRHPRYSKRKYDCYIYEIVHTSIAKR